MIERQAGTRKTTHREAKKEKTRAIAKERERAMDTSQLPERARVSLFPLLPLCVFSLCHLTAYREARCARLALGARTKLQTTGQRQHKTTTTKHEPHSCSAHCAQHMAHSTEHTAHSKQRTAQSKEHTLQTTQNTEHAAKPHRAQSTQHRASSKPHKAKNT